MLGQYYLLPLTLLLIILYTLTYFLYTDGTITNRTYKLTWIVILLVSSLIVSIIGIILEFYINYQIFPIDTSLIFWHVEAGIIATLSGIFHVHIYWKKFKTIF